MPEPQQATCHNCERTTPTVSSGALRFCPFCGQKLGPLRTPLREICGEFLHSLVEVDGKYLRTLRFLLFKPGWLTHEYFRGKRVGYLRPITLAMLTAGLFFFLSEWNTSESIDASALIPDKNGNASISLMPGFQLTLTATQVESLREASDTELEEFLDEIKSPQDSFQRLIAKRAVQLLQEDGILVFRQKMAQYASRSVAVLIPLMACLVIVLHRSQRPYYSEAIIYCLHVHSFFFLCFCGITFLPSKSSQDLGLTLLAFIFLAYVALSWHKAFPCHWLAAMCKAAILLLVHMLFVGAFTLVLALVTLAV